MKTGLTLSFLVLLVVSTAFSQPWPGRLGVNISLPERGGTFVDVVKENHRWTNTSNGQALTSGEVDSLGWPTVDAVYVIDWRPVAEWTGTIDDPEVYRIDASGTYACSFTGRATVTSQSGGSVQNVSYSAGTNTTTFNFVVPGPPGANHGLILLRFTNTRRGPADTTVTGFTQFRMLRPGYSLSTTQTFITPFLAALTSVNFGVIRFMNFTSANDAEPDYPDTTLWSHRKRRIDAAQSPIPALGKKDGAAWDYVVDLANTTGRDPWINVPLSASVDYLTRLATLLRDSLDAARHVYVESSNEVWNTAPGFNQSSYNHAQAVALGISDIQNHARRTVQLAQIFRNVFGSGSLNARVRVVLCSHQPMLKWWVEPMLQYINGQFGAPSQFLYAIACQTYYSGGAQSGESVDQILNDCHASIAAQVDETGGVNEAGRLQWIQKAAAWNLPGGFCSYEGGPDHGGGSTTNIGNRILAERAARMGSILKFNYDTCYFAIGGNIAMQFTISSGYNRYGCWGLTDDIANPYRNAKFQAAASIVGTTTGVREREGEIPDRVTLMQNYPNPFNPTTNIEFRMMNAGMVLVRVCDLLGRSVATLVDEHRDEGTYVVRWNAADRAAGVYFCRMTTPEGTRTITMLLVK